MLKLIIQVVKRLLILIALLTPLIRAVEFLINTSILSNIGNLESFIYTSMSILLVVFTTYTLITGNSYTFIIAIITSILSTLQYSTIPLATITCFILYLILDTVSTTLRGGELKYLKYSRREILRIPLTLLLVIAPATLLTYYIAYYTTLLITNTITNPELQFKPQVVIILSSPITRLIIIITIVIYIYNLLENIASIITGFIKPSYISALNILRDTRDLDIFYKPLFTWILYIGFATLIYTPLYVMIFDVLLVEVYKEISLKTPVVVYRYIIPLLLFTLLVLLARFLHVLIDPLEAPKRLLYASLILLALVYTSAVKLVFYEKGWYGLIEPGFQQLGLLLQERFVDYGRIFIITLETLLRLLGATP
jgi:hypothetical protein